MGRKGGQIGMPVIDMVELIPAGGLLREIDKMISFDFIYEILAPYYPSVGRPSVDPVSMFKMLLVGCLCCSGIRGQKCQVHKALSCNGYGTPQNVRVIL